MSTNYIYLNKLRTKCKFDDNFLETIKLFFDSLVKFGYISNSHINKLSKKMYENLDVVLFGNDVSVDYKSGYYDATKKELYIKDVSNLRAVFLHLMYVLSTVRTYDDSFSVGYSNIKHINTTGELIFENYGINRAIISNLVCRLLNTSPITLSIVPTYRTYENNFLGQKLVADNDIYFLEAKLFTQICYTLNLGEEEIYYNLFSSNPSKYLSKALKKVGFRKEDKLLENLDEVSKKYSNYNKLCYFQKLLNDNYINMKKHILNDDIDELKKENKRIKNLIYNALSKMQYNYIQNKKEDSYDFESTAGLSEKLELLENDIIKLITSIQETLLNYIVSNENNYKDIEYIKKLKNLEDLLLVDNSLLKNTLYHTINDRLLVKQEHSSNNLTEKIKYSLISDILSNDKFKNSYKSLSFRLLHGLTDDISDVFITLNINKTFIELVEINSLSNHMKDLSNNVTTIQIQNLKHLLNTDILNKQNSRVELIYLSIRQKYNEFSLVSLENMYICKIKDFELILIVENNKLTVLKIAVDEINEIVDIQKIELTDYFYIFPSTSMIGSSANLPAIIKKENKLLKKISSLFSIM